MLGTMPDHGNMTQIHGHRGCDDGVPPNTIPAFLRAAATGCHWLEMDVVRTGDGHVLVSHEPWMDHRCCTDPSGGGLTEAEGRALNLYRMSLEEIQRYRVQPANGNGRSAPKPTLGEVVETLRQWSLTAAMPLPGFNIEVKSDPAWYGISQPSPAELAKNVLEVIEELQIGGHCLIQSFDPAILKALHQEYPRLPLALLIDNIDKPEVNLERLGFTPNYYSAPHFLITEALMAELQELGMRTLTWTVNDVAGMHRMIGLGVHGLITDKPGVAMQLLG